MTKLELNDKLAKLYTQCPFSLANLKYVLLIDDWDRLMPLALRHDISVQPSSFLGLIYSHTKANLLFEKAFYKDHESPEAAAQYAIATALVKLAESKSCTKF